MWPFKRKDKPSPKASREMQNLGLYQPGAVYRSTASTKAAASTNHEADNFGVSMALGMASHSAAVGIMGGSISGGIIGAEIASSGDSSSSSSSCDSSSSSYDSGSSSSCDSSSNGGW